VIDIALVTSTVLASLRQVGWCEYTVHDEKNANSLMTAVRAATEDAGLRVVVTREGDLVLADVVTLD
jgi:hypothetical protein